MKTSKKHKAMENKPVIKVQLDYRTVITLKSKSALDMWLKRYPNAKILS